MAKATKRSRPGRGLGRKSEAWVPLRHPALLAALGLAGWAPAGAAAFPPTLDLSALDGTNGFRLNGVAAGNASGGAVRSAGDVNGDGLADLLIGASFAEPNGSLSGASYVVFGQNPAHTGPFPASLNLCILDGTNGFRLNGVAAFDFSGIAVSSAGDVNGDGLADFLIGADGAVPNSSDSAGASYVVFGRDTAQTGPFPASLDLSSLDGTNGFRLNGVASGDRSGYALSNAGDVNGDGLADLLIGAYRAGPNSESGARYVVFGRNTAHTGPFPASLNLSSLDGTNGFRLSGVAAGFGSGRALSRAGDVNGDGLADLLIGASRADLSGSYSRAIYVVFGTRTNSISYANSIRCQDQRIPSPGKGEGEGEGRAPHSSETLNPHPILPGGRDEKGHTISIIFG